MNVTHFNSSDEPTIAPSGSTLPETRPAALPLLARIASLFRWRMERRPRVTVLTYRTKKSDWKALRDAKSMQIANELGDRLPEQLRRRITRARHNAVKM